MDRNAFLREIPKIELHCHLEGSVRVSTYIELAIKHDLKLPPYDDPLDLYDCRSFEHFLEVYRHVCRAIREREDFRRITYETLEDAANCGVRYREMFWSPMDHLEIGVPYKVALDGIVDGILDAEVDHGIKCRMIAAINREDTPEKAIEMVNLVIDTPREQMIGIGLDYNEMGNPPEKFWKAYRQAGTSGLHRTAHAGEFGGHARNIETCLDLLGCERIDHGYRVLDDKELTKRCAQEGVVFTVAPTAHMFALMDKNGNVDWRRHPIKYMAAQGLKLMINSDDPAMKKISPLGAYIHAADYLGFDEHDFKRFAVNGIDGAWISETEKSQLRKEWAEEIDGLLGCLEWDSPIRGE